MLLNYLKYLFYNTGNDLYIMELERHQVKSKWYYIFWGVMAAAVVGGQIFVGLGYREMAEAQRECTVYWRNTVDRVLPRW